MVETYQEASRRRLMPPVQCKDQELLQLLSVKALPLDRAESVTALGERLLAVEPSEALSGAQMYASIRAAALDCASTLHMKLLGKRVCCHCIGAGVEELMRLFFGSCLSQNETSDDEVIVLAAGDVYSLVSRSGIWWTSRCEAPLSMVKCVFLDYLCRSAEDRFVLLHAAIVKGPKGVVLLMGPSYSGKSTLALHCHHLGLPLLGDDMCAVEVKTGIAQAVRKTINVRPNGKNELHLYPELMARANASSVYGMIEPEFFMPTAGVVEQQIEKLFVMKGFCETPRIEKCKGSDMVTSLLANCLSESNRIPGLFQSLCAAVRNCSGAYQVWSGSARATAEKVAQECLRQ